MTPEYPLSEVKRTSRGVLGCPLITQSESAALLELDDFCFTKVALKALESAEIMIRLVRLNAS